MLVRNCKILKDGKFEIVDILIRDEKIVKIEKDIKDNEEEILDAKNMFVMPGIVDLHTHMRDPGLTHKEDLTTGSMAAAKGGVTTFIDMPNTMPAVITKEILDKKREDARGRIYVDYGFNFGGSRNDNSSEIVEVVKDVAATKVFLNMSTGDMLITEDSVIANIFKASKIVAVHAEEEMVEKAIELCRKYDKPLYLCHLSKASEVEMVRRAKEQGVKVFAEVTPHHLFLNVEDVEKNNLLRMKPELKEKSDNIALWEGLRSGIIDTIGTDHAPHLISEKLAKLTFGIPGIENSLEMMLRGVKEGKISLDRVIEVMSSAPAKLFGIKNKGKLEIGYDGDLVIVDLENEDLIGDIEVVSKCNWTPYKDFRRGGRVVATILRGKLVYFENKFYGKFGREVSYE